MANGKKDNLQAILDNGLSPLAENKYALRYWDKNNKAVVYTHKGWEVNVEHEDIKMMCYLDAHESKTDFEEVYELPKKIEIILMEGVIREKGASLS